VIPIFDDKIVLITSRRKKRWIIPKGVIELGLAPEDSAAKEALEEAGVVGSVSPRELGRYEYEKWGGVCTVRVFEFHVHRSLESWDECEIRDRRLFLPSALVSHHRRRFRRVPKQCEA